MIYNLEWRKYYADLSKLLANVCAVLDAVACGWFLPRRPPSRAGLYSQAPGFGADIRNDHPVRADALLSDKVVA